MAKDRTIRMRRVSANEEMELADLDDSISYENPDDSSDTYRETENPISAESTSVFVSGAIVSLETVPGK